MSMAASTYSEAPLAPPVNDALLERIVQRITSQYDDACVVLFGSHATGAARPGSDLDVLVIAPSEEGVFAAAGRVYRALHPRRITIDVVFMTPEQFKARRAGFDPFVNEIVSRGRVLHGRFP